MRPTRHSNTSSTLIDNIFVNNINVEYFSGIIISDLSDHLPVFYISSEKLAEKNVKRSVTKFFRDINPVTINNFACKLNQTHWEDVIHSTDNADSAYNEFSDYFQALYNDSFPLVSKKFRMIHNTSKPWLSHAVLNSIRRKDALYRNYLQKKTDSSNAKYKTFKNKLTKVIRAAKKMYYENLFLEVKGDLRKTWSIIKSVINNGSANSSSPKELLIDGHLTTETSIIVDKFNKYFVGIGRNLAAKIPKCKGNFETFITESLPTNSSSMLIVPTDSDEVVNIIKELKINKSVGYDNISSRVIKSVSHLIASPLSCLCNLSFQTGTFPSRLKIAKVTPLHKSDDKRCINNYRPISVLPVFSKIIEKLMHIRLAKFLNKNNSLSPSQFGFRSKHSTAMAIINMIDRVSDELDKKNECVGIFIDLSKAFDTLDHNILLRKLALYGVRGIAIEWFSSYLSNRHQFVEIDNVKSVLLPVDCGVPQGSILGPLLFVLYVNDLVNVSKLANTIMFADDTNLFFSGSNLSDVVHTINIELDKFCLWFKLNKLSLNVKKTNFILFGHKHKNDHEPPDIYIDNSKIERMKKTKFLGVIINDTLTWGDHIAVIKHKIKTSLGIIARMRYLLPSNVLLSLYHTLVAPYYNYCNMVWAVENNVALSQLFLTQKKAVRLVTKSPWRCHTSPLFKKLRILPIMSINKLQTGCFMFCVLHNMLPAYFSSLFAYNYNIHTYFTRHSIDLHREHCRLKLRQTSLRIYGPVLWNSLPSTVRYAVSLHSFRSMYKCFLLSEL